MKTIKLLLPSSLIAILLTGCATSIPISSPNGKIGHAINCSAVTMAQCYQKAGEMCGGRGYNILNQKNQSQGFFTPADKSLVVECN
ncbi:hypothetical protein OO007_01290 [Cocleimonas sp. KMM 6892]|uniref:hypothetical protein n=1 Tax=unclassified Cocleimonas TaxID=2639732 RepID=UPI002DBC3896|nr:MULTISPECIES: hypothetical protein [unclassified Cocleimonas]MEB8430840.1 hypothetical protein [Cocleimonas sp. KMM 6892]MEC4714388.1 hypothetical protein [Cocleimonas sp. KMM 6895]MEC4743719.1 hypothetical protein [Cocleimonas sp. KMM 6896]